MRAVSRGTMTKRDQTFGVKLIVCTGGTKCEGSRVHWAHVLLSGFLDACDNPLPLVCWLCSLLHFQGMPSLLRRHSLPSSTAGGCGLLLSGEVAETMGRYTHTQTHTSNTFAGTSRPLHFQVRTKHESTSPSTLHTHVHTSCLPSLYRNICAQCSISQNK